MDQELGPILAKAAQPGIDAMIELANKRVHQDQARIQTQKREIRLEKGRKRQAKYAKKKQTSKPDSRRLLSRTLEHVYH